MALDRQKVERAALAALAGVVLGGGAERAMDATADPEGAPVSACVSDDAWRASVDGRLRQLSEDVAVLLDRAERPTLEPGGD